MTDSIILKSGLRKLAAGCLAVGMAVMQMAVLPVSDTANVTAYDDYEYPYAVSMQQDIDFHCFGAIGIFDEEETALIAERMYKGLKYHLAEISLKDRSEIVKERMKAYLEEQNGTETTDTASYETETEELPTEETLTGELPTEETLTGELPTEETSTGEIPTEESSTEETATEEPTTEELPTAEDLLTAQELDLYGEEPFPFIPRTPKAADALNKIYACVIYKWDVGALAARRIDMNGGTDRYISCNPYYVVEEDEYEYEFECMMEMLDEAVSEVNPNWSEAEKALYLHDWMAFMFDYNDEKNSYDDEETETAAGRMKRSPYALYNEGKAVCEGYARMYNLLLGRVGVESQIVISPSLKHGWNIVNVDGKWYHVDITKDDKIGSPPGTVRHNYFLNGHWWNMGADAPNKQGNRSVDWWLADGRHVCEIQPESVDDYAENAAFWEKSEKRILPYGDNEWLVVEDCDEEHKHTIAYFNLYDFDQENGIATCRTLHTENMIWWRTDGAGIDHQYSSGVIYGDNDYLFYYTPTELKVFSEEKGARTIFRMNILELIEHGVHIDMYLDGNSLYLSTIHDVVSGEKMPHMLDMDSLVIVADKIFNEGVYPEWQPWIDWIEGKRPEYGKNTVRGNGDINSNGRIDVFEVVNVHKFILDQTKMDEQQKENFDMDGDGAITGFDLAIMKRVFLEQYQTE